MIRYTNFDWTKQHKYPSRRWLRKFYNEKTSRICPYCGCTHTIFIKRTGHDHYWIFCYQCGQDDLLYSPNTYSRIITQFHPFLVREPNEVLLLTPEEWDNTFYTEFRGEGIYITADDTAVVRKTHSPGIYRVLFFYYPIEETIYERLKGSMRCYRTY